MNLVAIVLPEELGSLNFLFHGVDMPKDEIRDDFTTFPYDDSDGNVDIITRKNVTVVLQARKGVSLEVRKKLMQCIVEEKPGGSEVGNFFSSNPLLQKFGTLQILYVKDGSFWLISKLIADDTDLHFAKLSTGITILRWLLIIDFPFVCGSIVSTFLSDLHELIHCRDGYNYTKQEEGKVSIFSSLMKNTLESSNPFEHLCELFSVLDPFAPCVGRQMGVSISFSANETYVKILKSIECVKRKRSLPIPSTISPKKHSTKTFSSVGPAPKKPKGYISAFNFFLSQKRKEFESGPQHNKSNNEINVIMGSQWQNLPSKEKEFFTARAEKDKVRYLREVLQYNAKNPDNMIHSRIQPPKGYKLVDGELIHVEKDNDISPIKKKSLVTSIDASFHRPLNAYGYYSRQEKQYLNELARDTSANLQRAMGKRLAYRWSTMSPHEKTLYEEIKKNH